MPEVIIFHHALGVTPGLQSVAEQLRAHGYRVHLPDLFDGRTFDTIADGVAHAEQIGFDAIIERGVAAVPDGPGSLVVIGYSLGVLPAQKVAQTRLGVSGVVLCHAAVPPSTFGTAWPPGVAVQIHMVEGDPWVEEDLEAARELATEADAELHLYPGTGHLVADSSHDEYDETIAGQMMQRMLEFIAALE